MKKCVFHIGFLVILMLCSSCVSRGVREAQEVVAQADSLWHDGQMYGIDAGDSATLAQAYETLDKSTAFCRRIREIFPFAHSTSSLGTYSHACYHYGRLLREKDDPVAAMQAFINATHSHTGDYHILGRVYSNMGSICHLAGEFPLSYDMYERCADMYLQNGDTLLYYYGLNEMAFELAEQNKEAETKHLLDTITNSCSDKNVLSLVSLTKAALYTNLNQFDSVLLITQSVSLSDYAPASTYALKAHALWNTGLTDSALMYANLVMELPDASKQDKYNMLFILINGDSTLDNEALLQLSGERSDIEFEILNPLHHKVTIAVELLKADMKKSSYRRYIYLIMVLVVLFLSILCYYTIRLKNRRKQGLQLLQEAQEERAKYREDRLQEMENLCNTLSQSASLQDEIQWKDFSRMCQIIDKQFNCLANKLKRKNVLNEKEIRLCILVLLGGFTDKQMASILYYGENSIRGIKRYAAKKLHTTSAKLRDFLLDLTLEDSPL